MTLSRRLVILVPFLWLVFFFFLPFILSFKISLSEVATAIPPYKPVLNLEDGWQGWQHFWQGLSLRNYSFLATDDIYWKAYLSSLKLAFFSTVLCLIAGYPIAYAMAQAPAEWRPTLSMLVILPFWTSFLIRIYAWIGILSKEGLLNQLLLWLGVIDAPLHILNTNAAIYIGIVYGYLSFMVLPIYASLDKMDHSLVEAAQDLGCSRFQAFWLVTFPLSWPGIASGCFLVFIPAIGEYVIPTFLGGSTSLMIGRVLWEEFFTNRDWPVASAVAVVLLMIVVVPIAILQRVQQRNQGALL